MQNDKAKFKILNKRKEKFNSSHLMTKIQRRMINRAIG